MRSMFVLSIALLASPWAAAAEPQPHAARADHRFDDVERWVEEFESPDRGTWQKPAIIVRVLTLEPGQIVADLGAGTGYFTKILSVGVGESGKVYAVDVEPRMLEYIRGRNDLVKNVVTVEATPDDPKLPAREIDLVMVANTWHHIGNRIAYLGKLRPALSREGRVAIIDWREGEIPMGPPPEMRLGRDEVVAEFEQAGWRLATESVALPYQYFLVFYPPPAPAP